MESGSFESKKRKTWHEDEDEDEDEEEKMEKFYAIVNTIREARDRFIINNSNNKRRKLEQGWKPSFQPEDFMQEPNKPTLSFAPPTSQSKGGETGNDLKHEVKQGLDLDLTLSL